MRMGKKCTQKINKNDTDMKIKNRKNYKNVK